MAKQDNILEQLETKLKELRQYFIENVDVMGPYVYTCEDPDVEYENGAPVFQKKRGTLHITQFEKPVVCWFIHEDTKDSYRWPLEWFERNVHRLDIFALWSYSDGTYTGTEHFDEPAHWLIRPKISIELEKICQTIEDLTHSLNDAKYQDLTKQISKAIRSENPQWVQTKVPWTYIKDLDWAIKAVADCKNLPAKILVEDEKISNKKNDYELTDTERYMLEALGDETLKGQELLNKAGYDYSSHYRQILANLCKRNIIESTKKGYRRMS